MPQSTPPADQPLSSPSQGSGLSPSAVEGAAGKAVSGAGASVLLDLAPAVAMNALTVAKPSRKLTGSVGPLPRPRVLPERFSGEQRRMRMLAQDVALDYARRSGVARAGLDTPTFVALFTSMIHRESNYNARAVSSAGASGLGQLMPGTARAMGVCDVFSARDNLEGSARYLTLMLDRFASPSLALAAYNAGPGAVEKYGGIPPYRETTQYVADIVHAVSLKVTRQTGEETADTAPIFVDLTDDTSAAKTCL